MSYLRVNPLDYSFPEPCQPVITSAQVLCNTTEVQISWDQASGVENYLVTATGGLGYVTIHNTSQTLLSAALLCGQNYSVTVQGQGSECDSLPSSPAFFKTGMIPSLTLRHTFRFFSTCIYGFTFASTLFPQLRVSPVMSLPTYNVRPTWAQSAGDRAMVPNLTLPRQPGSTAAPTGVSPTPPPALGKSCTVEMSTLL